MRERGTFAKVLEGNESTMNWLGLLVHPILVFYRACSVEATHDHSIEGVELLLLDCCRKQGKTTAPHGLNISDSQGVFLELL